VNKNNPFNRTRLELKLFVAFIKHGV